MIPHPSSIIHHPSFILDHPPSVFLHLSSTIHNAEDGNAQWTSGWRSCWLQDPPLQYLWRHRGNSRQNSWEDWDIHHYDDVSGMMESSGVAMKIQMTKATTDILELVTKRSWSNELRLLFKYACIRSLTSIFRLVVSTTSIEDWSSFPK